MCLCHYSQKKLLSQNHVSNIHGNNNGYTELKHTTFFFLYTFPSLSPHLTLCYSPLVLFLVLLSPFLFSLLAIPLCFLIDINAQARKLQRNRAKGTLTLPRSSNSSFCRSLSETSLNQVGAPADAELG